MPNGFSPQQVLNDLGGEAAAKTPSILQALQPASQILTFESPSKILPVIEPIKIEPKAAGVETAAAKPAQTPQAPTPAGAPNQAQPALESSKNIPAQDTPQQEATCRYGLTIESLEGFQVRVCVKCFTCGGKFNNYRYFWKILQNLKKSFWTGFGNNIKIALNFCKNLENKFSNFAAKIKFFNKL